MNINLNPAEVKVLAFLSTGSGEDFGYFGFRAICKYTKLKRDVVRRACRRTARAGLTSYGKGLWTVDGDPAGSGYAATKSGRARADASLVKKYALERWQ
jgi:hypothetical protein